VASELTFDNVGQVSVFETTIRILGGLLSAYDLSGEPIFLEKANDLGQRLLPAFDSPSGVPHGFATLSGGGSGATNTHWHRNSAALAELGTLQLEFRYLARSTGNAEYEQKAMRVLELMEPLQPQDGLFPVFIENLHKVPKIAAKGKISMGALGDSFYEYLLKVWLQGGKQESQYRRMYDRAMEGVHAKMVRESEPNGLYYIAELDDNNNIRHDMDHLACFMGGNLALGAYTHPDGLSSPAAQRDLQLGKALAYTCYQMYARTSTGMAAETVRFRKGTLIDFSSRSQHNLLRPETVETFFILYYLTKDPIYREWGWEVFESIEKCCRTHIAYASLKNVNDFHKGHEDRMESFFPAETLKYLYLLQDPDLQLDILNTHVFNTEAHPLRIIDEM